MSSASVIVATCNRPEPLRNTLNSILAQSTLPLEVIIVDSSEGDQTRSEVGQHQQRAPYAVNYWRSAFRSAARQRNLGADHSKGTYLVFIDDDVELEPEFLEELLVPFLSDCHGRVGGVSGTIVNQHYIQPRGMNFVVLAAILGDKRSSWAGRLVGPAVNFLPADEGEDLKEVGWLFSTGVAYRRTVFSQHRFGDEFDGYSFAEDVHLSARVGRDHILLNTRRARFFHRDMGGSTHRDWMALGKSMVLNRHKIMVEVLGRTSLAYHFRLFFFEIVYGAMVQVRSVLRRPASTWNVLQLFVGKLTGFWFLSRQRFKSSEAGTVNTR